MHPDLICDECIQQYKVGIHKEDEDNWPSYILSPVVNDIEFQHMRVLCPRLIKLVIDYNYKIVCPRCKDGECKDGLLSIPDESRFNPKKLLFYIKSSDEQLSNR